MKHLFGTMLILMTAALIPGTVLAGQWRWGDSLNQVREETGPAAGDGKTAVGADGEETMIPMTIQVGDQTFEAALFDNEAARALAAQLPMTVFMTEMNGNEKYYYLPESLPAASENVENIHTGDLMLFGTDCLVLFYEDFQTSYRYTRLGAVSDPGGLARALGRGDAAVSFGLSGQ